MNVSNRKNSKKKKKTFHITLSDNYREVSVSFFAPSKCFAIPSQCCLQNPSFLWCTTLWLCCHWNFLYIKEEKRNIKVLFLASWRDHGEFGGRVWGNLGPASSGHSALALLGRTSFLLHVCVWEQKQQELFIHTQSLWVEPMHHRSSGAQCHLQRFQ